MDKYFMAIDGSTSKVGISIWDLNNYELIKTYGWSFSPKLSLLEKANFFKLEINKILNEYNVINACIEAPKVSMMNMKTGKEQVTSAKILKVLSQINFAYQYILYSKGIKIEELDENLCKRFSYPAYKVKRNGVTVKQQYQEQVLNDNEINNDLFNFTYEGRGGIIKNYAWVEDIIDSIIVGKAYLNIIKENISLEDIK